MTARRMAALAMMMTLAACGTSPKTHYFTLAVVPQQQPRMERIATPVTVAAVHLPAALDRRQMVRRTGANTVAVSDQDRWSAPLADMTRRVLAENLAARLGPQKVVLPEAPSPPGTAEIVVTIADFGPSTAGSVRLDGNWSLLNGPRDRIALDRNFAFSTHAAANGGRAQAAAMSGLLGRLATQIATTLHARD